MNSKKLISLLSASAMAVSAFSGLALTANAAETDVFTYENGSTSGWTMPNGTVATETDDLGEYLSLKGGGSGERVANFTLTGTDTLEGKYVIEFDSLIHGSDGQGKEAQSTQITFHGSNKKTDTRVIDGNTGASVGTGFAVKYDTRKTYKGAGFVINDPAEEVLADWTTSSNYVDGLQNVWTRTQAVIDGKTATITVIDAGGTKLVDGVEYTCDASGLTGIQVSCARGDGSTPGDAADPGYVYLDNIHIYAGDPETLTTDGLRGDAKVQPTVMPEPEVKDQAPSLTAPEGVTAVVDQKFDTELNAPMGTEAQTITDLEGLSIAIGGRPEGGEATTSASTEDYAAGDKVLKLSGGSMSGAGRGPVVSAADPLAIADGSSSVMTFAVNLSSFVADGAGRLYILKDANQAGEDKTGAYNNVMAVLTTDGTAESFTQGESTVIGVNVDPYTWYVVSVVVSADKYRVYVNKAGEAVSEDPAVSSDHVGQGDTASPVTQLPLLAVTSGKGGEYTGSVARIDNMLTYTGTSDEPRRLLPTQSVAEVPTTPEPVANVTMTVDEEAQSVSLTSDIDTKAVLVQASYRTDKTLAGVKAVPVELTANTAKTLAVSADELNAFTKNDKFIIVNSLDSLVPLAKAAVVATGADQATPLPTVAPTEEVTTTPSEEATTAPSEEATTTPSEEVTTAPSEEATTTPDTSDVVAVADREVPADVTPVYEVKTTEELGGSTVYKPEAAFRESFGDKLPATLAAGDTVTVDFDIYVADGESISLGAQRASDLGTMFKFTAADGAMTVGYIPNSSGEVNMANLDSNTWYNVKLTYSTKNNTDSTAVLVDTIKAEIRTVDVTSGVVGDEVVASAEGIGARNSDKTYYNCIHYSEVTGEPMVNNFFVYTDADAAAAVTE